jgi:hypothetical protein
MERQYLFERNLLALSQNNPELCKRLSGARTNCGHYRFTKGRNGESIPAIIDEGGAAHTLHSIIAPAREAERLLASLKGEQFIVILGLGAAFLPEAALKHDVARLLVIDYDIDGLAELLCECDYANLFQDIRFFLLCDPQPEDIENYISGTFLPALHNGISVIPLRARTALNEEYFASASCAVKTAIDKVAGDYSVQAVFGKRWFSNTIRNLEIAEKQFGVLPPIKNAAICAAGPSLDGQIETIRKKRATFFLIATDTALPTLLDAGLPPDAIVSIDCQHISYHHFMNCPPLEIPLFLDLSSPPLLASLSKKTFFFSGNHPFTKYITQFWRQFPSVDTSGGNVTYTALSLSQALGARHIEIYGADFSYPKGKLYTHGGYIYPYFHHRQNRLCPCEAQASSFLFRTKLLHKINTASAWYYETPQLTAYRERFETKARSVDAEVIAAEGEGAPLAIINDKKNDMFLRGQMPPRLFASGKALCTAREFLSDYRRKVEELPEPGENITSYIQKLPETQRMVFTTLLPLAAAIKYRSGAFGIKELLSNTQNYCLDEIKRVTQNFDNARERNARMINMNH